MTMLLGAKLPDFGALAINMPPAVAAVRAEAAGFDSVWVSDHVVMTKKTDSPYPFSASGEITWKPAEARLDALVAMAMAATTTTRVEIGVAVLIAAMRNPVVLAKQIATIDALASGRVVLGVGAGWLAEEYEALNAPFNSRGARLDAWIEIMRACWKGEPEALESEHYKLPAGVLSFPVPARAVPIVVGGMSKAALRRAREKANGWLAFQQADSVDIDALTVGIATLRTGAEITGALIDPRVIVRLTGPTDIAARQLAALAMAGVTEVIVEVDWGDDGPERTIDQLRNSM